MAKTRIEIHLEEAEVEKLDKIADKEGRSRKNFCETKIRDCIQDLTKPNVEVKTFEQPKSNYQIDTRTKEEKKVDEKKTTDDLLAEMEAKFQQNINSKK